MIERGQGPGGVGLPCSWPVRSQQQARAAQDIKARLPPSAAPVHYRRLIDRQAFGPKSRPESLAELVQTANSRENCHHGNGPHDRLCRLVFGKRRIAKPLPSIHVRDRHPRLLPLDDCDVMLVRKPARFHSFVSLRSGPHPRGQPVRGARQVHKKLWVNPLDPGPWSNATSKCPRGKSTHLGSWLRIGLFRYDKLRLFVKAI